MPRRSIAVICLVLGALLGVPAAQADTTNIIEPNGNQTGEPPTAKDGFQALTCTSDTPQCSPESPYSQFFTQAAGHPPVGFTQYIIRHGEISPTPFGTLKPIEPPEEGRTIKTLRVDLPPGFTVNPEATPRCELSKFLNEVSAGVFVPACDPSSVVGKEEVTLVVNEANTVPAPPPAPPGTFLPVGYVIPPNEGQGTKVNVYNLQPKPGEPALFGFVVAGKEVVFLETAVAWENDYHESFTIKLPPRQPPFSTLASRLVNFGTSGDGTYLNNPTTCFSPLEWPHLYSTWFRAESYEEPDPSFPSGSTPVEAKVENSEGKAIEQTGCAAVPFDPALEVDPGTNNVDSPSPATLNATLRYYTGTESPIQESHLRRAEITTPLGSGLNPSAANGLVACTDAQFKKGVRTYSNGCPAASKVGTVSIESPPLPPGALKGDVYVGQQKSNDPQSGEEFRIFVEAKSEERGIDVRVVGNVKANPTTGQLTAVFNEQQAGELAGALPGGLPQVPFTSVKIKFDGATPALTSPPTCSAATTTGVFEPWARPGTTTSASHSFTLTSMPGGGSCPTTLAGRPFSPTFSAKSDNNRASKYFPFRVSFGRSDGEQELKGTTVVLPEGLAAKLRGVAYCSDTSIAAAAADTGAAEIANPSCGAGSRIGTATVLSGTGANPLKIKGDAFLAGPYKGAPLSMVVVTPAVAGPFDLGTVVVRVALEVNPVTTRVTAKSDVVPDVFGGVKLDIRRLTVELDRPEFMHNPSGCEQQSVDAAISGGGANPADPSKFSTKQVSEPYAATECNKLAFDPRLQVRLLGGHKATRRRQHPAIKAVLKGRTVKDSNVKVATLTLPHSMLLDNAHIKTICTRVQLAAHNCPKASVYGKASAVSPLIEGVLRGPVYLVSSNHKLPDLVADLRGQVEIQLHGVISTVKGRMQTRFVNVPDQPVTRFTLQMRGGGKGLVINSTDVCKNRAARLARLVMKAHNGKKKVEKQLRLVAPCGHKKKHHK